MVGAKCLLSTILEELKQHTEAGNGSIAYDVATALICAPDVTNEASLLQSAPMALLDESGQVPAQLQRRIPLRTALKHMAEGWNKIQKSDPSMAEIVVRLYRRVEAQMALPPDPQPMLESNLALEVGNASLNDAIAAAAAAADNGGDGLTLDTSVDLGLGGAGDLGLTSAANSTGGLDLSEQDIFGGLGDAGDFNISWGADMDLG
jgi:mediator of RNA polymerase II transcription subunit 5